MVVVGAHELYVVDVSIRKYNAYGSEGFMSGGEEGRGYGEGGFGGEPSGGEGRREGTPLKPTTGQYVVGTRITALCACVCAYTL